MSRRLSPPFIMGSLLKLAGVALLSVQLHGQTVELPNPLVMTNGAEVKNRRMWREKRRPELLSLFREHVYGYAPIGRPDTLKFETTITPGMMGGTATRKQVTISYEGGGGKGAINLVLFVPAHAKKSRCFVLLCNRGRSNIDPTRETKSEFWPAEQLVARGYAAAAIYLGDVAPDKPDSFSQGVHGISDAPGARPDNAWGTIGAWSWGASRVMDYLETDKNIDAKRVAVIGHSRGGKAALWAGAQDERFALTISNDSGSTGAALARGKTGERIKDINKTFPHWFNANYKKYDGRENELPVDQHLLSALIAPRLLYIASATEDKTADPEAEFQAAVAATPVYRLFGLKGLTTTTMPHPDAPLHEGHIGYHLRSGIHDLTLKDWNHYMDFADQHLK